MLCRISKPTNDPLQALQVGRLSPQSTAEALGFDRLDRVLVEDEDQT